MRDLSEDEWLERLLASVTTPTVAGRRYPGFPDEDTQKAFVGSAYGAALEEGFRFYRHIRGHLAGRRFRVASRRYLDFGCGWGRIGRIFLREFERSQMVGVDVDPGMIAFCKDAQMPGDYLAVPSAGPLPFADRSFGLITAYSVFTHLPQPLFRRWLDELLRVTAPGGLVVLTVEPERFLDFVSTIDACDPPSGWHAALRANLGDLSDRKRELQAEGLTFLPTGGGPYRPPSSYGDTVVTRSFVAGAVAGRASVLEFLDNPEQFWQAVVVLRRHRWSIPFRHLLGR